VSASCCHVRSRNRRRSSIAGVTMSSVARDEAATRAAVRVVGAL
jgi:hypothetical protein